MANKLIQCPVCGAEMAASAKVCPKCGAKNKKPFYKKWWFYAIVAVAILCAIGGAGNSDSSPKAPASGGADSPVSAESAQSAAEPISYAHYQVTELFDALKNNPLKAENTFKGQYVELEGYLENVDSGGQYIGVGAKSDNYDYMFQSVQCYIKSDEQRNQVMEMNKDDPITVRGKIKSVGEVLGYSLDIDSIG